VLVHDPHRSVTASLDNVGYTSILQMLFMFSVAGSGKFSDLLRVKLQNVCSHGTVRAQDLNINFANVDPHSSGTGEIFALPSQDNQPCRFGSLGIGAKDRGYLGVITLPLFRLLFREKLPKFADHGLHLSSAEQGLQIFWAHTGWLAMYPNRVLETKYLCRCLHGFLQDSDLACVIEGMLHDSVEELVKRIAASGYDFSQTIIAEMFNNRRKLVSGPECPIHCRLPCRWPGIFDERPVLLRRHVFDKRRHRNAAGTCRCQPGPDSYMQHQFPDGVSSRYRMGTRLLRAYVG